MKTICSCFTYIIAIMFGLILNVLCLIFNFIEKDWGWFVWDIIVVILGVLAIRWLCNRAKRIEDNMQRDIQSLLKLQAFALLRMTFENYPDFNPNGFRAKPKDKEDELEEH